MTATRPYRYAGRHRPEVGQRSTMQIAVAAYSAAVAGYHVVCEQLLQLHPDPAPRIGLGGLVT